MTKKSKPITFNAKSIFVLAVTLLLCFVMFFCTACGEEENTSTTDKEYSKTENDTAEITNGSFEFGTYALDLDDYPKTSSITGWSSVSADNAADSSKVNSGIIKVKTKDTTAEKNEAWDNLIDKLYKDSEFLDYAKDKWNITETDENDIKAKLKENFQSPNVRPDGNGDRVLMINNYTSLYEKGFGTAQKATSNTTITLKKGEYGVFSVWVYTTDLTSISNGENGANVRLINTFNSQSQADYAIYGIDTNNNWKKYSIYVAGDANYDTTFKVALGLGTGNGKNEVSGWTQGTAYFDDLEFKTVTADEYNTAQSGTKQMIYKGEDTLFQKVDNTKSDEKFAFSMQLNTIIDVDASTDYFSNLTPADIADIKLNGSTATSFNITANNSKDTLTLKDDNKFKVANEKYAYISFKVDNKLNKLNNTNVTVFVYDTTNNVVTNAIAISEVGEKLCGLMIKNNFPVGDDKTSTFYLEIVVGPTNTAGLTNTDLATGEVKISDLKIATGSIESPEKPDKNDPEYANKLSVYNKDYKAYNLYSFYSSVADKTVTLGSYVEEDSDYESYSLSPAPSSYGKIITGLADVNGYTGVNSNSVYLNGESETTDDADAYDTNNHTKGYAGLVNTKYFDETVYTGYDTNVRNIAKTALSGLYDDNNLQPLMIHNNTATSYGYIGSKMLTVSASSFAKISVKVRVVDKSETEKANAFIYLVDAYGMKKEVFTLDLTNTDANAIKELSFNVNSQMMEEDGWITLSFYVATGATEKKFRLEMWNGSRDGATTSTGTVFFDNVTVSTSNGFTEYTGTSIKEAAREDGGIFYGIDKNGATYSTVIHERELDENEIKFNEEYPDDKVSYEPKFIWVKSNKIAYAVFNTVDPVAVDPYESQEDEETDADDTAVDPATFWLSLSSILVGVALVLAIIMLIVKRAVKKRKANASDAKSHYKVTSRVSYKKNEKKERVKVVEDEPVTEEATKITDESETAETEENVESLDEYVYGDVQDFGEKEEVKAEETEKTEE